MESTHSSLDHQGYNHISFPSSMQASFQWLWLQDSSKELHSIFIKSSRSKPPWLLMSTYRTSMKTHVGLSPLQLVYGKSYYLPVEMEHKAYQALKFLNFDSSLSVEKRKLQLQELEEMRLTAYDNSKRYKEKVKIYHDRKLLKKEFHPGL